MSEVVWILGVMIAILAGINTICWGYAIAQVGTPQLRIEFWLGLVLNKFFISAMVTGFLASLASYVVLSQLGVLAGRFFLSLSLISMMLAATLVLGEQLSPSSWVGIALISIGSLILGRAG